MTIATFSPLFFSGVTDFTGVPVITEEDNPIEVSAIPQRVHNTRSISFPFSINVSDCKPNVVSSDTNLYNLYFNQGYETRSAWSNWEKGPLPPPFLLSSVSTGLTSEYIIYYRSFDNSTCPSYVCSINCTSQDIMLYSGETYLTGSTFCVEGTNPIYRFSVSYSSESAKQNIAASFNLRYTDELGNINDQQFNSIKYIVPRKPLVNAVNNSYGSKDVYVLVMPFSENWTSIDFEDLDQFVIEKSENNTNSFRVVYEGWLNKDKRSFLFVDKNIPLTKDLSYRVKFRNSLLEETEHSDWTSI